MERALSWGAKMERALEKGFPGELHFLERCIACKRKPHVSFHPGFLVEVRWRRFNKKATCRLNIIYFSGFVFHVNLYTCYIIYPTPRIALFVGIPDICHGHTDGVRGEKVCHVEKFQISVHDTT